MKRKNELNKLKDESIFFKLVKDCFVQKRKTLRNNLKNYNLDKIEKVLINNKFDLNTRAEQLPIGVFIDIANEIGDSENEEN